MSMKQVSPTFMVVTELKMGFQKLKLYNVAYRDYKHFDNKSSDQTFKVVPQKKINALRKLLLMHLLKERMFVLTRLPS